MDQKVALLQEQIYVIENLINNNNIYMIDIEENIKIIKNIFKDYEELSFLPQNQFILSKLEFLNKSLIQKQEIQQDQNLIEQFTKILESQTKKIKLPQCNFYLGMLHQQIDKSKNYRHFKNIKSNEYYEKCIENFNLPDEEEKKDDFFDEPNSQEKQEKKEKSKKSFNDQQVFYQALSYCKWGLNLDFKNQIDEKMLKAKQLIFNHFKIQKKEDLTIEQQFVDIIEQQFKRYFSELEYTNLLVRLGFPDSSWKILEEIGKDKSYKDNQHEYLYFKGLWFYDQQKYEECVSYFKESYNIYKNNAKLCFKLAYALEQDENNNQEAVGIYKQCIDLDPEYGKVYYNLGVLQEYMDLFEEAEISYQKCIDTDPSIKMAYNNLGLLKVDKQQFEIAYNLFKKAIEIDPNYKMAVLNLAESYSKNNKLQEAVDYYLKFQELDPQDFDSTFCLGELYEEMKNYEEAIKQFEKCFFLNPQESQSYIRIGEIFKKQGEPKKTIAVLCQGVYNFDHIAEDIEDQKMKTLVVNLVKIRRMGEKSFLRLGLETHFVLKSEMWKKLTKQQCQDICSFYTYFSDKK